jgi:demethylmenaquinone methyltransferase / 2-methoxy-6-polyprenyl-1,4-benzoquinol methylase
MKRSEPNLPQGADKVTTVRAMFDRIAPRYDLVNRIMTLGMDVGWRRAAVGALRLPPGSLVVDVACGTGDFCRELEKAGLRAVGIDMSAGMLAAAKTTVPLVQADALRMPFATETVDGIACGFALRNVVDLPALFDELARLLRPGGRFVALEVAEPDGRVLRAGHRLYFRHVVPVIGGALSNREAYRYLPESTAYLPERPALLDLVRRAGFRDVSTRLLALGAAQLISGTRTQP